MDLFLHLISSNKKRCFQFDLAQLAFLSKSLYLLSYSHCIWSYNFPHSFSSDLIWSLAKFSEKINPRWWMRQ